MKGKSQTKLNRKGEILRFPPESWRHSRALLPYLTEAGVWIRGWVTLAGLELTPSLPGTWVMQSHVLEQRKQHTGEPTPVELMDPGTCYLVLVKSYCDDGKIKQLDAIFLKVLSLLGLMDCDNITITTYCDHTVSLMCLQRYIEIKLL